MKSKYLILSLICLLCNCAWAQTKVACVGNSVTFGYLVENRQHNAYPAVLGRLLGDGYTVGNFGRSGATLLSKGHNPYIKTEDYAKAIDMKPDIAVIHLGLNDTDPRNYPIYQEEFAADYLALIESFRAVNPRVRIIIARMSPIFHTHWRFNAGTRVWYNKIQTEIEQIAKLSGAELIDFQEVLYNRPDLLPDAIHPNVEGAAMLARRVYQAISGNFGGLQLSPMYSDNMVIQKDKRTRISGVANSGETVEVTLDNGAEFIKSSCCSNSDGKWSVYLPLTKYGKGYRLKIKTESSMRVFENVAIGEVWVLSGQSNMSWSVSSSNNPEKAVATDNIRLFKCNPDFDSQDSLSAQTLARLNNLDYVRSKGWSMATADEIKDFSAIGFYFAQRLNASMPDVIVGLVQTSLGGATAESFVERGLMERDQLLVDMLTAWTKNPMVMQWCRDVALSGLKGATNPLQRHFFEPVFLYESRIKPLSDYSVKGVLWYQGESNAENTELHEAIFPNVVQSFRNAFNNQQLPFYFVQLSSLNRPSWSRFRESQLRMSQSIPNCQMVVSCDYGHPSDVHPRTKDIIGERLANVALGREYGFKKIEYRSPRAMYMSGNDIVFTHTAGSLSTSDGAAVRGFEVSDDGLIYHPVQARIKSNKIILNNPTVAQYVRYGWQPFTDANVVNGAGLPLSTFKICQKEK